MKGTLTNITSNTTSIKLLSGKAGWILQICFRLTGSRSKITYRSKICHGKQELSLWTQFTLTVTVAISYLTVAISYCDQISKFTIKKCKGTIFNNYSIISQFFCLAFDLFKFYNVHLRFWHFNNNMLICLNNNPKLMLKQPNILPKCKIDERTKWQRDKCSCQMLKYKLKCSNRAS